MIKIEIIAVDQQSVTAAYYYPVPDSIYSAASVDLSRTPAGDGLSVAEFQLFQEGKLWEVVQSSDPESKTQTDMRIYVEGQWDVLKPVAKDEYIRAYSYTNMADAVGKIWDGSTWS